jgi:hypothetical protein
VKSKPYIYEKHLAPHDIMVHEFTSGMTRQATARMMGFNLVPVPKVEIISGIDAVRGLLDRCFFNETKCASGIQALENYKKEWNDKMGTWRASPHHDANSHCADAFRTLATGIHFITGRQTQAEIERDRLNALKDASGSLPGSIFYDNGQVRRSSF